MTRRAAVALLGGLALAAACQKKADPPPCRDCASQCRNDAECVGPAPCESLTDAHCVRGSCIYQSAPPGIPCVDGDPCTEDDVCDFAGNCVGTPRACIPPAGGCSQSNDTYVQYTAAVTCDAGGAGCDLQRVETPCPSCDTTCAVKCDGVVCADTEGGCHHAGLCDVLTGACTYTEAPDAAPCDWAGAPARNDGVCQEGVCVFADCDPAGCDAGHVSETRCNPMGCGAGIPCIETCVQSGACFGWQAQESCATAWGARVDGCSTAGTSCVCTATQAACAVEAQCSGAGCFTYVWAWTEWGACEGSPSSWESWSGCVGGSAEWGNWSACSPDKCDDGTAMHHRDCVTTTAGERSRACTNDSAGTKTRSVTCKRSDDVVVADTFCAGTKPDTLSGCWMPCSGGATEACAPLCTGGLMYEEAHCEASPCDFGATHVHGIFSGGVCGTNPLWCSGAAGCSAVDGPYTYPYYCVPAADECCYFDVVCWCTR